MPKVSDYTLQRHRGRAIRKWWGGPDNKNKLKTKIIKEKQERKGNKNEAEGFTCIRKTIPHKQVICIVPLEPEQKKKNCNGWATSVKKQNDIKIITRKIYISRAFYRQTFSLPVYVVCRTPWWSKHAQIILMMHPLWKNKTAKTWEHCKVLNFDVNKGDLFMSM